MKNQSVIKATGNKVVKIKTSQRKNNQLSELEVMETKLNKMWDMFKVQVERNYELMSMLNKQNERSIPEMLHNAGPENATTANLPVAEQKNDFKELSFEQANRLTKAYQQVFGWDAPRLTTIHAYISFMHTLYYLNGSANMHELFMAASVTDISGYRYLAALRNLRMISVKREYGAYKYYLTPTGRKFMEGELINKEQYLELIKDRD